MTHCSGVLFADFQHLNAAFKTTFSVTTVKLTAKHFPAVTFFSHKEFHLRCFIGLELNIVTWSTKILKGYGRHPPWSSAALGKYEKLTLLDALRIHFQRFFCIKFFAFIKWTRWGSYQLNVYCDFVVNFCWVYLVEAQSYLILSNPT